MRAAAAFGASALVTSPGRPTPTAPKTVRASMGALFGCPCSRSCRWPTSSDQLPAATVYGLAAHGGEPLDAAELRRPAVLVVGAERAGLSRAALGARRRGSSPSRWRRPPAGAVESLNAGVAGAIALYEFSRRPRRRSRRPVTPPPRGAGRMTMDDAHLQELKQRAPGLAAIYHTGRDTILRAADLAALEQARVQVLGRKSALTEFLRSIPTLPAEERPLVGKGGNLIRKELEELVEERESELKREALSDSLAHERIDVTLPGQPFPAGHEHLISQTMREVEDIFIGLGYSIAEGPEVELDYYNFTALNTPPSHPARSAHDTFWVVEQRETMPEAVVDADRGVLLRTHTSPVQVRVMEQQRPPVYVVCLGKVYRRDSDATHTPMFHQVEGLVVDEGITLADLKGTVAHFTREFFGGDRDIRVRPHFFPFTEPSIEVDVSCELCGGKGCRSCKYSGWLEIMGAGMVDPAVYSFVDYDPEKVSGFAFGMGVERMAMLKHGIPDLRLFYDNDVRFLRQF